MSKYQVSIERLNGAVGLEISTLLQYFYFHTHLEDKGYKYLAKLMKQISIAEMLHVEMLAERILFLEGEVETNPAHRTVPETDVKRMLEMAIALEESTVDNYNKWARECSEAMDSVSHKMFQDIIAEEEVHLDDFRRELDKMRAYGDNYLALQSIADGKSSAKDVQRRNEKNE